MARAQVARLTDEPAASKKSYTAPSFRGEEALGYCLRRAQVSIFQKFISSFKDVPLRPVEFSILTLIQDNPGRKQTEISLALGLKRANFVPIIDGLEARGLVERRPSPEDRRANPLHLTQAGTDFLAAVHKRHEALESEFTSRLGGPAKRKEFIALLHRLL